MLKIVNENSTGPHEGSGKSSVAIENREQNFSLLPFGCNLKILPGYQIYHNFIREHEALGNITPGEACGIKINGENKWKTLIENASVNKAGNREAMREKLEDFLV